MNERKLNLTIKPNIPNVDKLVFGTASPEDLKL